MPLFPSLPDHLARAARSLIAPVVVRPHLGGAGARRVAQSAAGGVDYLKGEKEAYMTEDIPVGRVEPILNRLLELPPKNLQICAPFSNFTNATGNTRKT